jgi:extracellular factor (EF) 3-hydroxypalmitic acid methyl ester biosynthesis protein
MRKVFEQMRFITDDFKNQGMRDLSVGSDSIGDELANLTVLVIDDDPSLGRLIERSMEDDARVLQWFDFPKEGELDLTGIDLVMLDYVLPSHDGLMLLEEIRNVSEDLPVIFMTGYGDGNIASKAIELGASEYVAKPFEPVVLRRVVNRLVRAKSDTGRSEPAKLPGEQRARVFQGTDQNGDFFEAQLEGFEARSAVVRVEGVGRFEVGDVLSAASVLFGSSKIDFTTGRVEQVIPDGDEEVLKVQLTREWLVVDRDEKKLESVYYCVHSEKGDRDRGELPGNLRLAAIDLAAVFREIHDDVTAFEVSLDRFSPVERVKVEGKFLDYAKKTLYQRLTEAVIQFEAASELACSMGCEGAFQGFSRKLLYPHVLSSPFMARIVERPIGVPGDFDMLGQILGTRFRGESLFGRLINEWILSNPATDAYRHRVRLLEDHTRAVVKECSFSGRRAKVMSMASGVAYEVQRYVQKPEAECEVEFTLVDFSEDTLVEARNQFTGLGDLPESASVSFEQSSVIELANSSRSGTSTGVGWAPDGKYDVVYCAGLFDYLSDRMVISVTRYLNTLVADGGLLMVSNYTTQNPFAHFMGLVLDWELVYRSESHFDGLMQKALGQGNYQLKTDKNAVEVYGIARH